MRNPQKSVSTEVMSVTDRYIVETFSVTQVFNF